MFVAIDRTSKFAFAELHERATRRVAADFLRRLVEAVPYRIHTVLTDNGTHFTDPKGDSPTVKEVKRLLAEKALFRCHAFVLACAQHDVDHRLTKPHHPWTNGQVERMNRTIKDATVRRSHYKSHDRLREHLKTFLGAYNFAKRLKALKGLTAFEFILKKWTAEPQRLRLHPNHLHRATEQLGVEGSAWAGSIDVEMEEIESGVMACGIEVLSLSEHEFVLEGGEYELFFDWEWFDEPRAVRVCDC